MQEYLNQENDHFNEDEAVFADGFLEQEIEIEDLDQGTLSSELAKALLSISEKIDDIDKKFETKIKVDCHKNALFDNMHKELIEYKNETIMKIVDSVLLDIIQVLDNNQKTIERYEEIEFMDDISNALLQDLKNLSEDLTDILYRASVEPYTIEGPVDTKKQKIIKFIYTDKENLHNTIAKHFVPGYERNGKVIRPERIAIYKYKKEERNNSNE